MDNNSLPIRSSRGGRGGGGGGGGPTRPSATTATNNSSNGSANRNRTDDPLPRPIVASALRAAAPAASLISQALISGTITENGDFARSAAKICVGRLAQNLRSTPYAIIGACALGLLGINRAVEDVEVFVPAGETGETVKTLCAPKNSAFKNRQEGGKLRVWYEKEGKRVNIYFREPGRVQQEFPACLNNGTVKVGQVYVLKPTLLLNIRCASWTENRAQNRRERQDQDAADIDHLLKFIALQIKGELPHANAEFLLRFAASKPIVQAGFMALGIRLPPSVTQ
ncbi:uncharacterized protein C8A04DRAFT_33267 [Dichotomopilus funicola]|uniref:Uncharacterized protein n=1 Tax=Dichotomopilus funicola TaxID=1934379 RepID=A0AAN6ZIN1_9PEZI|nr:hypothetical protein C8A04DRAFT_33267 [Dichotomopilus funicola]